MLKCGDQFVSLFADFASQIHTVLVEKYGTKIVTKDIELLVVQVCFFLGSYERDDEINRLNS